MWLRIATKLLYYHAISDSRGAIMDPRSLRAFSRQLVRELGLFAPNCCHSNLTPEPKPTS